MSAGWAIYLRENPQPEFRALGLVWHVCLDGVLQEWFFDSSAAHLYIDLNADRASA